MEIVKIKLTNFRSHKNFTHDLSPLTIITGPNGIGKTNILEAVLTSSTTRSHRTNYDRDLIFWQESFARCELDLKNNEEKIRIATFITNTPAFSKSYLINNSPKKASEVIGTFQSVVFSPETMNLVYGPPIERRRFLDIILCQNDRHYMRSLNQYNRVIRERNKLLFYIQRGDSSLDELDFWDKELVDLGASIIENRQKVSKFLNEAIKNYYQCASDSQDIAEIIYKTNINPKDFLKTLQKERTKELKYASTLFGPHRDDLLFYLNHHPLASNGSRGECRSFVLSIKFAEIDYFNESGKSPVLLLDDVFSELDQNRRLRVTDIIKNQQTIITATDIHDIDDKIIKKAKIIQLPYESPRP